MGNSSQDRPDDDVTRTSSPSEGSAAPSISIPGYTIRSKIGSGGMGAVYEAIQHRPRRPVAIKVMKRETMSPSALRRFEYEAHVLARLSHPYIAQVYEAGTFDDPSGPMPFFAMEYIPNAKGLTQYAREKKLGVRERLEMFARVCDAVHHGHQKGVIHRDLKPSNILVDSSGNPRIIDFGVARTTDSDVARATVQTELGRLVGSLQYMSPEQCDADPHDIDTRSDVYALGVVLYELLSGSLPYDVTGTPLHEAARRVRDERPALLGQVRASLRGEIETIVRKALEKERDRRYQSAHGLAQDIRRYLVGEAIAARPPSVTYQMRVFARRNKTLIGAAVAVLVVLVAAVVVSSTLYLQARAQRELAREQTRKMIAAHDFVSEMLASAIPTEYGQETTVMDLLDRSSAMVGEAFPDEPESEAEVCHSLGMGYANLDEWDKAIRQLRRALELRKQSLGQEHEGVIEVLGDLQFLYFILGRLDELEAVESELLEIHRSTRGESHEETLAAMVDLAGTYVSQGRLEDAETLIEKTLSISREVLGEDHDLTLDEMAQRARLLSIRGDLEEAERLNRKLLLSMGQRYGEAHRKTRDARSRLAGTLIAEGKLDEAGGLYGNAGPPSDLGIEMWFQGERAVDAGDGTHMFVFWETWCPFSQRVLPEFDKVYQRHRDDDFEVIGLTGLRESATEEKVRAFIEEKGLAIPIAKENGTARRYFDIQGTPWAAIFNDGRMVWEGSLDAPEHLPAGMIDGLVRTDRTP